MSTRSINKENERVEMRGGEGKGRQKICLDILCYRSLRSSDFRRKRRKGKKLARRLVLKEVKE